MKKFITMMVCLLVIIGGVLALVLTDNNKVKWVDVEKQQLSVEFSVDEEIVATIENFDKNITNIILPISDEECCGWFFDKDLTKSVDYNKSIKSGYIEKVNDKIVKGTTSIKLYTKRATPDRLTFTLNTETDTYEVRDLGSNVYKDDEIVVVPRMFDGKIVDRMYEFPEENSENIYAIGAFYYLSGYVSGIYLPATIKRISNCGFNTSFKKYDQVFNINLSDGLTSIGRYAFHSSSFVGKVVLPDSIVSIDKGAFCHSTKMVEISLPKNLTRIEDDTFRQCSELKKIYFGDKINYLGAYAFSMCNLEKFIIPDTVTEVANCCFNECKNLTSITIGTSVTKIGSSAFYNCEKLQSIDFPSNVTEIGDYLLTRCKALKNIFIPKTLTLINGCISAFCDNLTNIVVEEGNPNYDSRENCNAIIETATNTLFQGCKTTKIPNSVKIIENSSFSFESIEELNIPEGVTTIKRGAFYDCLNLKRLSLPSTLSSFELYRNYGENLEKIEISEDNVVYSSGNNANCIIEIATKKLLLGCKNTVIPSSVTTIGQSAFKCVNGLRYLEIPDTIKKIESSAFTLCKDLACIYLPSTIEKIEAMERIPMFSGCNEDLVIYTDVKSETDVIWDKGWNYYKDSSSYKLNVAYDVTREQYKTYENYVKENPDFIFNKETLTGYVGTNTEVVVPNFVTKIGSDCFYQQNITSVVIPEGVTEIGYRAFQFCQKLSNVILPTSLIKIGDHSFQSCKLSDISIPEKVEYIGIYAFCNNKLTNLHIPARVNYIGEDAFSIGTLKNITVDSRNITYDSRENCNAIIETATNTIIRASENTIIPSSVTAIGNWSYRKLQMTSFTIPENITSIGRYAFANCDLLESVNFPQSLMSIGDYAFLYCYKLTEANVPDGCEVGNNAFKGTPLEQQSN